MKKPKDNERGFEMIITRAEDVNQFKIKLCIAIRDNITQRQLTQKEVAILAKVGVKTVSYAVNKNISKLTIEKLLRILDALVSDLEFSMTIN